MSKTDLILIEIRSSGGVLLIGLDQIYKILSVPPSEQDSAEFVSSMQIMRQEFQRVEDKEQMSADKIIFELDPLIKLFRERQSMFEEDSDQAHAWATVTMRLENARSTFTLCN